MHYDHAYVYTTIYVVCLPAITASHGLLSLILMYISFAGAMPVPDSHDSICFILYWSYCSQYGRDTVLKPTVIQHCWSHEGVASHLSINRLTEH